MKDLIQYISETKNTNPNKILIKSDHRNYTYKEIAIAIEKLAKNIFHFQEKQDNIALLIDDSPEFIIAFLAIQKSTNISVPVPLHLDDSLITKKLMELNPSAIIYDEKYRGLVEQIKGDFTKIVVGENNSGEKNFLDCVNNIKNPGIKLPFLNLEKPSMILFSSGTTGGIKKILLSHKKLISNALACHPIINNEKNLNFLSYPHFSHYSALSLVLALAISTNGSITLPEEKKTPHLLEIIKSKEVDIFLTVPKNIQAILTRKDKDKISRLRYTLFIGGAADQSLFDQWYSTFKTTLLQGYGLTESLIVSFNTPKDTNSPSSIGHPVNGCDMKVMNHYQNELPDSTVGELYVNSDSSLISYYNSKNNKKLVDKWLPTGDFAKRDKEGYYHYIDRKLNIIHRNGFTIFPAEIEAVMCSHPDIAAIHVLKLLGEKDDNIKFCIIPEKDSGLQIDDIKQYAKKKLPQFLQPEFIEFYQQFPENYLGKVLRHKFIHSH